MNNEFKKSKNGQYTVYTLESATGSGSIASVSSPMGGVRRRGDNLIAQEANTDKIDASKPRNFVAKNAKTGGAGAHKDKKKAAKQGDVKHKNKQADMAEADKHSFVGKIQRGHELKKKVDSTFKDIGNAQKQGDHPEASKAFRKHERYANLERPGTWTKVKDEGVAEGLKDTAKKVGKWFTTPMDVKPKNVSDAEWLAYLKLRSGNSNHKTKGAAEGSEQQYAVTIDAIDHGVLAPVTVVAGSPEEAKQKAIAGVKASMIKRGYELIVRSVSAKPEQGVAEGKDDKIAQLKKDHDTAVHWSKNETSPQKREAARQKAEKIKRHLDTQYKQGVAEDKGMTQYNAFKREWRAKHGADAKVPGYDSKEYTSYCYRQNDKKQGVAEDTDIGAIQALTDETLTKYLKAFKTRYGAGDDSKAVKDAIIALRNEAKRRDSAGSVEGVAEGAKVDRMVKHVAQSEKKLGHSKKEAENIAWATANKRGMLDNKNKKVK